MVGLYRSWHKGFYSRCSRKPSVSRFFFFLKKVHLKSFSDILDAEREKEILNISPMCMT